MRGDFGVGAVSVKLRRQVRSRNTHTDANIYLNLPESFTEPQSHGNVQLGMKRILEG